MIANLSHGRSFGALCAYLIRPGARVVDTNLAGRTPREYTREFCIFRRLNPRVRAPVFHAALRLLAHENLSDDAWREAVALYRAHLGYDDTAYLVVRHPEQHVHLVACRVRFDGRAVRTWQDYRASQDAAAAIEARFGLASAPRAASLAARTTHAEHQQALRAGQPPRRTVLAACIDVAIVTCDGTLDGFTRALAGQGVQTRWRRDASGELCGGSFRLRDEAPMRGGAIGTQYAWHHLSARLDAVRATRDDVVQERDVPLREVAR